MFYLYDNHLIIMYFILLFDLLQKYYLDNEK